MKDKHFMSLLQVLFAVFAFALMILIALGISFNLDAIKSPAFWITVSCQTVVVMIFYNLIMQNDIRNQQLNKNSAYYRYRARFVIKSNQIYLDKALDENLDIAIKNQNEEWLQNKQKHLINKVTTRLSVEELTAPEFDIDKFCERYFIKNKKKLIKIRDKIVGGRVTIKELTRDRFLSNKDEQLNYQNRMTFNGDKYGTVQNILKALSFVGSTAILAMIQYSISDANIFQTIVTNSTLILGACFSGLQTAKGYIKHMGTSFDERANFLTSKLDIKEEPLL